MPQPDPRAAHAIDDRYDGVLSRMALSGGWAALAQLERHFRSPTTAHALVAEASARHLARLAPLRPGRAADGLVLHPHTAAALAGRDEFIIATRRAGTFAALQRLEYLHRHGRPLYPPPWLTPALLARPGASPARLDTLEEAILGLFRSPYLFYDFHPDGPAIALVDVPFRPGDLEEGLAGLRVFIRHFARPVPLTLLAESTDRADVLRAHFAATPRVPDGVRVDVIDLDTRCLYHPADPIEAIRLGAHYAATTEHFERR
ncbi:MAG: hypothetical protein H6701_12040 [Myxococcales bacterium]|nr:hypothetical protein [Myxococcales bacterium]